MNLERQARIAQRRLWLNRWLRALPWCLSAAGVCAALTVFVQRSFELALPLIWSILPTGFAAVFASLAWTWRTREDIDFAAAVLDEHAGLRERISTGRYCLSSDDPFAAAVVADADRFSTSVSARRYIHLHLSSSYAYAFTSFVFATLMFLVPPGLLVRSEVKAAEERSEQLAQTQVAVKRQMERVQRLAEATPALSDLKEKLLEPDKPLAGKLTRPSDVRHEAIKKIDALADAVKDKRTSDKFEKMPALRKMLRGLDPPKPADAETQNLSKALARGDFKAAKEEIESVREQLGTLKSEEDKELVARIGKQLDDLAKQLEHLEAEQAKKLAEQLQKAGIKQEDAQRMLENLKKADLDQLRKQLQEKGLNQHQINKLAKQLQQQQQAGSVAKNMAKAMKQAGQAGAAGQTGDSMAGLSAAADQLSNLEQLEQEMNQLDSALADLQDSRTELDNPCPHCNGSGCSRCRGQNGGEQEGGLGRRMGHGRGGLAPEAETDVGFRVRRGKVETTEGAIIGQFLIEGEQVKGDVSSGFSEVVSAAERDATDRINRNQVPRQYHDAVKKYFSNVNRSIGRPANDTPPVDNDKGNAAPADDARTNASDSDEPGDP